MHKNAVPRLGGISFFPSMMMAFIAVLLFFTLYKQGDIPIKAWSMSFVIGLAIIYVVSIVDDLNKFVADSCIAVAPVQIAAGIQNKVLVAMANAIPVVLTSLIAKAIPELHDGENCFIRDDNQSFADICLELLNNQRLRTTMREQGRKMVIDHYSWDEKLKGYELLSATKRHS